MEAKLRVIKSLTASLERAHPDDLERAVAEAEKIVMPYAEDQNNLATLLREARQVVKLIKMRETLKQRIDEFTVKRDIEGLESVLEEAKGQNINTTQARKGLQRLKAWRDVVTAAEALLRGPGTAGHAKPLEPTHAPKIAEVLENAKKVLRPCPRTAS